MLKKIKIVLNICSYLIAGLLILGAGNKVVDYATYVGHIGEVGLMPMKYARVAAPTALLLEIISAVLLINSDWKGRIKAWWIVLGLMPIYSYYVYHIINIFYLPVCSCRGLNQKLSWTDHYWVNGIVAFITIGTLSFYYYNQKFMQMEKVK